MNTIPQDNKFELLDLVKHWENVASQIMGMDVKLKPLYADLRDTYFSPEEYFDIVIKSVSEITTIPVGEILSSKRNRNLVEARFIAYHLLNNYSRKYSWELTKVRIGRLFKRDHATIIHGLDTYNDLIKYDKQFRLLSEQVYDKMVVEMVERVYKIHNPNIDQ